MSGVMGDSLTAYSGRDWLEKTDWTDEGYFSWVVQPSASLLAIIQAVSDTYLQGIVADCSPLIYVLNAMALQRLVDLNRLIKAFEYLLHKNDCLVQKKLMDDAGLSLYRKKSSKWKRRVSDFTARGSRTTLLNLGIRKEVTAHQISFELLSDTVLYEQRFVRRHMASRFLQILDKLILPIFSNFGEVDLNSSPNWPDVVSALDNSPNVVSVNKHVLNDYSSVAKPISHSFE
ncbi:hypothetical protein F0562_020478 [Nyssa sinensis]|uniref:Uncharacterized protein n=1 Tax=Nyssa sinensis TaxID=561372 RepID=A0A5J5BXS8_9ASTE|nr:hypothetical protein F0562_020478 [Nyssa sinensis]